MNREHAVIGKAEQVGMHREQAQEAERRQQKTGMDRDGSGAGSNGQEAHMSCRK